MAKKKASKKKTSPVKEFTSSPFKRLKGLSAFDEQQRNMQKNETGQKPSAVNKSSGVAGEEHSFADEMGLLGVKPLPGVELETLVSGEPQAGAPVRESEGLREERDKAAFLKALGSMENTFEDEWPEQEPGKQAVPRRMRQVERGQLKPQAKLDLHGLTVDEASVKVSFFLQDCVYRGFQTVLIITGKGLHSKEGPVLRTAIEKLLNQQKGQVLEWGHAPQRYGGSGALIAFLRGLPEV